MIDWIYRQPSILARNRAFKAAGGMRLCCISRSRAVGESFPMLSRSSVEKGIFGYFDSAFRIEGTC